MIEYPQYTGDAFPEDCLSLTGIDRKRQVTKFTVGLFLQPTLMHNSITTILKLSEVIPRNHFTKF